jgi:hypothetical protein
LVIRPVRFQDFEGKQEIYDCQMTILSGLSPKPDRSGFEFGIVVIVPDGLTLLNPVTL